MGPNYSFAWSGGRRPPYRLNARSRWRTAVAPVDLLPAQRHLLLHQY